MDQRRYVYVLILSLTVVIVVSLISSRYLFSLDIPYSGDDVLKKFQLDKIRTQKDIDILIVGDSSAGNAIDAQVLAERLDRAVANVALTGGDGIMGSYNMIRHAKEVHPDLQAVIVIQTLDIWRRSFSMDGYIDTLAGLDPVDLTDVLSNGGAISSLQYLYNPKELYWYFRYKQNGIIGPHTIVRDYIQQGTTTFASGRKTLSTETELSEILQPVKFRELQKLGALCVELQVNCVFMHGPIHGTLYERSRSVVDRISYELALVDGKGISVVPKIFAYPNSMMGDSKDHIDIAYKTDATLDYAAEVVEYLQKP